MGISLNIATQLARITPHIRDCKKGVMLGRQTMNLNQRGWKEELVKRLNQMGYVASTDSILQEDGFCETFLSQIGWPPMESADFMDAEGADYVFDLAEPLPDALNGKFDLGSGLITRI